MNNRIFKRKGCRISTVEKGGYPRTEPDGRVLNPSGVEIDLPFWAFKRLKKLHLLERDRETGKRRICARVFELREIWEGPEFRPNRAFKAFASGLSTATQGNREFSLSLPAD
jgi:hypothetical protein